MASFKILDEDLPLITELLETLSITDVCDKWEVKSCALNRFLYRNGTCYKDILSNYRIKIMKAGVDIGEDGATTARRLGLSGPHFYKIRGQLLGNYKHKRWYGVANARV
jgi:hypothetical protein